jgi:hypothetical protein
MEKFRRYCTLPVSDAGEMGHQHSASRMISEGGFREREIFWWPVVENARCQSISL